jgi:hypothetical protein
MSTKFLDGPAKGKSLELQCAPEFLRVVIEGRKVDALDLPDDEPAADEIIHRVSTRGRGEPLPRALLPAAAERLAYYRGILLARAPALRQPGPRSSDVEAWCNQQERFAEGPRIAAEQLPGQRSLFWY